MAMGGFSGSDPALTPDKLGETVKAGEIKYFLVSGRSRMGGTDSGSVTQWIKENCEEAPNSEWSFGTTTSQNLQPSGRMGGDTLYVYKGK